jgi:hypothetical protein
MVDDDKSRESNGENEGEDEGGAPKNGDDKGVKEDQKPLTSK